MRSIFILVPSFSPAGPVKGAVALANGLAASREVTLVAIKPGPGADARIDPRVRQVSLARVSGGWLGKVRAYRQLLLAAGGRPRVASISLCFSADLLNRLCRREAFTCASVRGNLPENYRYDYGLPGTALAWGHLHMLRGFDRVTALSVAMAAQLAPRLGKLAPEVIGNFVDEAALEPHRQTWAGGAGLRLVFVGSLSHRKQPRLAIEVLSGLGPDARLDVIGIGPLRGELEASARDAGLTAGVNFHGQLADPLPLVAAAHALLLPSFSEGIARAALEALHLGVPCVLRDVDGNRELIQTGHNGALFRADGELPAAVRVAAALSGVRGLPRPSLLPDAFRQEYAVHQYLQLIDSR